MDTQSIQATEEVALPFLIFAGETYYPFGPENFVETCFGLAIAKQRALELLGSRQAYRYSTSGTYHVDWVGILDPSTGIIYRPAVLEWKKSGPTHQWEKLHPNSVEEQQKALAEDVCEDEEEDWYDYEEDHWSSEGSGALDT